MWTAFSGRDRRSADERLAEVEAARAIPDSENAALIYNALIEDPNATSILEDLPESVVPQTFAQSRREPWLSRDLPELAGWVKRHQVLMSKLLEASRLEKCRFPISIDIVVPASEMDRAKAMHHWGFLLTIAANNDLADGRNEAALARWQCLLRMGSHLRQQPILMDHLVAVAVTRMALEPLARFIVAGDAPGSRLQEIERLELPIEKEWAEQLAAVRLVEALRAQKLTEPFGPVDRLRYHFMSFRMKRVINSATRGAMNRSPLDDSTNECRCALRGIRILIALKQYQTAAGHWPQSLDEIKPSLFQGTLTDPINEGPFVYRPTGSTFVLYSKGKNNIDDHGQWKLDGSVDDWAIWPPREPSPARQPPDPNDV